MYVRNLSGTEYPLQASPTWQSEINGNRTLSLTILPTKVNNVFIADISEMWAVIDDDDVAHKVVYAKRQGVGNTLTVDIKAVPLFYDDFDNLRIYEEYYRHMTAMAAFTLIFADTDYNFVLHDSHDAIDWEGFGAGETRLETFKRALNRYGAEFELSGNTVHLKALIGRDTQFQYRHRLNASNIVQEIDASGFWTYAKGYGDFGGSGGGDDEGGSDWQDAKLIREYTSPLAQIPSIGIRHAPPIKDGRVKVISAMDKSLKAHVDESLKVSVTTDIHDLRKQGYALAQPQLGDRVFLTDERIGFDEEVRVVAMSLTKDWSGNVTHFSITIGDEGVTKRYMSNMNTAIDNITNLIAGTQKLPNSVLSNAILQATKALQDAQTELTFGSNGILAIDKVDPNNVTILNSAGIGVSTDGGASFKNAITGGGVVAETIVGNSIFGVNITSADHRGYFHVNGADAEFYDTVTSRKVSIGPSGLYGYNAGGDVRFQADNILVTSSALGTSNDNVYLAGQAGKEARVVDIRDVPSDGQVSSYRYLPLRASGIYGNFFEVNAGATGMNLYLRPRSGGEVRITGANTTDVYYPLRAANIYGTGFITTTTNAYVGTDSSLHVVNKGFVDGSSGSPIYRDIRGNDLYGRAFITTSTHAYIGTDGELRVVNKGLGDISRDIRGLGFIGNRVSLGTHISGTHFHVQPAGGGEVWITNRNGDGSFRPIRAYEFNTDTSLRENKRNIDVYDIDVLDVIRKGNAYLYNRVNEPSHTKKQLGLMLDEMPYETYSERGDGFGIYGLIGFLFRGLKQAVEEIDKLKGVV